LNDKFKWNPPSKKQVDERIMALGMASSLYGGSTKIYTQDKGILNYMQHALKMLVSNDIYNSSLISGIVKSFLKQLRKTDLRVLSYDRFAKEFINETDVQGRIRKNICNYSFPTMSAAEKKECIQTISHKISRVFNQYPKT
jgi:hypothetical protein